MDRSSMEHGHGEPQAQTPPRAEHGRIPLDSVLLTEELARRPARPPDYEAENRALVSLAQEMANTPANVLQKLVEVAMELCQAHAAGISLWRSDKGREISCWDAVTGQSAVNLGGIIARDLSPCGVVLDRNSVLLLAYPERHYDYPVPIEPPIVEALLIPLHVANQPVGTLWVVAHDESRKFDAEDARVLQTLGKFASSAYQVLHSLDALTVEMDERKQTEKTLTALVNASSEVLYRMSPDWSEMRQLGGGGFISNTESPNKDWLQEYIPSEDQPAVLAAIQKAVSTKSGFELEHRVRRIDGTLGWTISRAVPLLNEKGEITEWFGAASDVTARKQAEEALRESKNRLRMVIEHLGVGIIVVDPKGAAFDWNRTALRMYGYDEHGGQPPSFSAHVDVYELHRLDGSLLPADQWPARRLLRGEEMCDCEFLIRRKADGWERIFSYGGTLVRDEAGQAVMGLLTVRDVTEFKKAQQALVQNEKLASVGRMAATIAHEINNPLAAAMNVLYLASRTPALPDSVRAELEVADQELRRIAHITKQTLGFYREGGAPTAVDVPEILDGTLDLYAPKLKNKSVRVERKYRGPGKVYGFEGELRQVVSNLVVNSIDALPDTGGLYVRSAPWTAQRPMVRVTIADTGGGISPENLKQIFEPFFTTKQSIGTGLGLWVTKELVKKHEGSLRVRSRIGKGTVFSIWLPSERRRDNRVNRKAA